MKLVKRITATLLCVVAASCCFGCKKEEKEPTFGERIAEAFVGTFENFWIFCQDFFISIIWMLPAIIIAAVAIPLVLFFRKKKREKKEAERRAKEEKK